MQAHARVCEENKRELEKNDAYRSNRNNFMVRGTEFEGSYGDSGETYRDDILKDDLP